MHSHNTLLITNLLKRLLYNARNQRIFYGQTSIRDKIFARFLPKLFKAKTLTNCNGTILCGKDTAAEFDSVHAFAYNEHSIFCDNENFTLDGVTCNKLSHKFPFAIENTSVDRVATAFFKRNEPDFKRHKLCVHYGIGDGLHALGPCTVVENILNGHS